MTKLNFKLALVFILIFGFSFFSLAQAKNDNAGKGTVDNSSTNSSTAKDKAVSKLCERIESSYEKFSQKEGKAKENLERKRIENENRYMEMISENSQKITEARKEVDENFEENILKMFSGAQSEEDKAAIEEFGDYMEKARNERRSAVDEARSNFQEVVRNQVRNRNENMNKFSASFSQSIEDAYLEAAASCEAGDDMNSIRDILRESVKSAKNTFQNRETNREQIGKIISEAAQKKNEVIKDANYNFQEKLQKAIDELKSVLSQ